jgi:hypothetical protein
MATMIAVGAYEAWPSDDPLTCDSRAGAPDAAGVP